MVWQSPTHVPQSIGHLSVVSQRRLSHVPSPQGVGPVRESPLLASSQDAAVIVPSKQSAPAHRAMPIRFFYQEETPLSEGRCSGASLRTLFLGSETEERRVRAIDT
jgi:hypothetical protein